MTETIAVPRPHVPYGPRDVPELLADADYLDHAARNLTGKYEVGGSNVRATVVQLLHDTATALRAEHEAQSAPLMEALGYIDRTLDNGEGGTHHWRNDEVMLMLSNVRAMLVPIHADGSTT